MKRAIFGNINDKKSLYCFDHKKNDHVYNRKKTLFIQRM